MFTIIIKLKIDNIIIYANMMLVNIIFIYFY